MNLKDWNKLQIEYFKEHKLSECVDVYRVASMISYLRQYSYEDVKVLMFILELDELK